MPDPIFASDSTRPVLEVLGDRYTVLLSVEETNGAYSLFEFKVKKGHGSPPHVHTREDESFYVLSGEVDFSINGELKRAKAGDVVFGPRGIPHNFTGASEVPARLICIASPGGFEKFFEAVGKWVTDKDSPPQPPTQEDIDRLKAIAPEFGLKLL